MALLSFGALIAAAMAFCIGGNDSANMWGSTVGSGAIKLRYALLLGGLGEWLGATMLGYGVSSTIRKGVSHTDDPQCWACGNCDSLMAVYAVGMLAALIGAACFLAAATFWKMPVSTTHAIVGGVVGMTVTGTSIDCVTWGGFNKGLGGIITSWVLSPVFAGILAAGIFGLTDRLAVRSRSPVRRTLAALPVLYGLTTFVMVLLTLMKSKPTKRSMTPMAQTGAALLVAAVVGVLVRAIVVPRVRRVLVAHYPQAAGLNAVACQHAPQSSPAREKGSTLSECSLAESAGGPSPPQSTVLGDVSMPAACSGGLQGVQLSEVQLRGKPLSAHDAMMGASSGQDDRMRAAASGGPGGALTTRTPAEGAAVYSFRHLLVFVAFLESFAHGANDTANATSAFAAIWFAYTDGLYACSMHTHDRRTHPQWPMSRCRRVCFMRRVLRLRTLHDLTPRSSHAPRSRVQVT